MRRVYDKLAISLEEVADHLTKEFGMTCEIDRGTLYADTPEKTHEVRRRYCLTEHGHIFHAEHHKWNGLIDGTCLGFWDFPIVRYLMDLPRTSNRLAAARPADRVPRVWVNSDGEYDPWPSHAVAHLVEHMYGEAYNESAGYEYVRSILRCLAANNLFIIDYTHADQRVREGIDEMLRLVDEGNAAVVAAMTGEAT